MTAAPYSRRYVTRQKLYRRKTKPLTKTPPNPIAQSAPAANPFTVGKRENIEKLRLPGMRKPKKPSIGGGKSKRGGYSVARAMSASERSARTKKGWEKRQRAQRRSIHRPTKARSVVTPGRGARSIDRKTGEITRMRPGAVERTGRIKEKVSKPGKRPGTRAERRALINAANKGIVNDRQATNIVNQWKRKRNAQQREFERWKAQRDQQRTEARRQLVQSIAQRNGIVGDFTRGYQEGRRKRREKQSQLRTDAENIRRMLRGGQSPLDTNRDTTKTTKVSLADRNRRRKMRAQEEARRHREAERARKAAERQKKLDDAERKKRTERPFDYKDKPSTQAESEQQLREVMEEDGPDDPDVRAEQRRRDNKIVADANKKAAEREAATAEKAPSKKAPAKKSPPAKVVRDTFDPGPDPFPDTSKPSKSKAATEPKKAQGEVLKPSKPKDIGDAALDKDELREYQSLVADEAEAKRKGAAGNAGSKKADPNSDKRKVTGAGAMDAAKRKRLAELRAKRAAAVKAEKMKAKALSTEDTTIRRGSRSTKKKAGPSMADWDTARRRVTKADTEAQVIDLIETILKRRGKGRNYSIPSPLSSGKDIVGHHGHRPHGTSIRWPALYEHLKAKGYSKRKAAMISNGLWRKKHGLPPKSVPGTKGKVGVNKRDFTADERRKSAKKKHALKDGSFPIENREDLRNAMRLVGHAKNPSAARAHIKRRAKALGVDC